MLSKSSPKQKSIKKPSKWYYKTIKFEKGSKPFQNFSKKLSKNLSNFKKVSKSCQTSLQKGVKKHENFGFDGFLSPF